MPVHFLSVNLYSLFPHTSQQHCKQSLLLLYTLQLTCCHPLLLGYRFLLLPLSRLLVLHLHHSGMSVPTSEYILFLSYPNSILGRSYDRLPESLRHAFLLHSQLAFLRHLFLWMLLLLHTHSFRLLYRSLSGFLRHLV